MGSFLLNKNEKGNNMFEKFTEGAIKVIMLAQEEARRMGHNFVGTEQLLLGVIGQRHGIGGRALAQLSITLKKTRKEIEKYIGRGTGFVASEIPFTPRAKRVLEMSIHEGQDLGVNYVGTEHVLLSLINETDGIAMRTLDKLRVNIPQLRHLIFSYIEEQQEEILKPPLTEQEKWALAREKAGLKTPALDLYTQNITKDVIKQRLDPVIGRDDEINSLVKVLGRRRKNNPVLVGEAGVGKTACAEGLAILMQSTDCPEFLYDHTIRALDLGSVLAGTKYRGEFEERMKHIIEEVTQHKKTILVIDEIHTLVGAGAAEGAVDAANLLKPPLARGKFRCIGAATNEEYKKYIEKDAALERRFQPIKVAEPSVSDTIDIIVGLKGKFETHHGLTYQNDSIEQAVTLSDKFIADRYLPDKAIDVIDEAGSRVRLASMKFPGGILLVMDELQTAMQNKEYAVRNQKFDDAHKEWVYEGEIRTQLTIMKQALLMREKAGISRIDPEIVTGEDVAEVVSGWTGIPMTKISDTESKKLLDMEGILHKRLIGQHKAIVSVSKAIRRARVGLRNPDRPIASFIFAGPTGVGKTELTKALASYMFGSEDVMVRLDMSEYMEKHTVAKLIGSPPGYVGYSEGGQLTEAVRSKPYTVVLFDEVEKAHPDVFNLLLQILDDGRLTDSKGRTIDFKNTLIIMTSNVGAKIIEKESGIQSKKSTKSSLDINSDFLSYSSDPVMDPNVYKRITFLVNEELKKYFRPEFLNRLDEIIVFSHLTKNDVKQISEIMIKELQDRMKEKEIELDVRNIVKEILVEQGFDPIYGARPLRRAVMRLLEDNLAQEFLSKALYPKTKIIIDADLEDNIIVNVDYSRVDPKLRKDEE